GGGEGEVKREGAGKHGPPRGIAGGTGKGDERPGEKGRTGASRDETQGRTRGRAAARQIRPDPRPPGADRKAPRPAGKQVGYAEEKEVTKGISRTGGPGTGPGPPPHASSRSRADFLFTCGPGGALPPFPDGRRTSSHNPR